MLHIIKDSDLSLNMWFQRSDISYAKSKKLCTHEGPSTKEKNDEHMKACVLKKREEERKIAMF